MSANNTHEIQVEQCRQNYTEPIQNAPGSTGYADWPVKEPISVARVVRKIIDLRDTLTTEQLLEIEAVLTKS